MPKSRMRKKSKESRHPDPQTGPSGPLDSLLGSDWKGPTATYAAAMTDLFAAAEKADDQLDRGFVIKAGHRAIRWESWPQCIAATRAGTRCLQMAIVDNPGTYRNGAYEVEIGETYGSPAAEAFRRLLTQRCHLHDNSAPAEVEFEGQVSAVSEDWLVELQQVASGDAVRAEETRQANRQKLTNTKCSTCGVVGSLKCIQSSGQTKLKGFHMPRLQAAFGETNQGRLPII